MNSRKVKVENQILVALGCRMTTDIEVAKQLVKTLLHVDIVIVRQHGERERLAKATGTDEKEILVRVLGHTLCVNRGAMWLVGCSSAEPVFSSGCTLKILFFHRITKLMLNSK